MKKTQEATFNTLLHRMWWNSKMGSQASTIQLPKLWSYIFWSTTQPSPR